MQSKVEDFSWRRVLTFGAEGSEAGNFCRPWGVTIVRYSDLSTFWDPWAFSDHETSATSASSSDGTFNEWSRPVGAGLYLIGIADRSNNRIQMFKFDAMRQQATFLHMFGDGPGSRHGQFDRPAGIVFNPKLEQIIVADKDNHRVQVFNMSGTYLFKFGEQGSKCGQFCYPWDIDICKTTHNIIVSDTRNRRVQMFNNLGRYITHFSQPLDSPRSVVFLSPTQLLVSDFNKHRLVLISQNDDKTVSSSTTSLMSNNGINYLNNNINNNNNDISISNQFNPSGPPKLANQARLPAPSRHQLHESKFIGFGEGSSWGEFKRPQGATANGSLVYCSDSRNNRVTCWDKETQNFSYISRDVVELDRPAGLAAIGNYIVIVDFGNNRVHICQRFSSLDGFPISAQVQSKVESFSWRRILTFGSEGSDAGKFCRPWGVAIARYADLATFCDPWSYSDQETTSATSASSSDGTFNEWSRPIGAGFSDATITGSNTKRLINTVVGSNNNRDSATALSPAWSAYLIGVADRSNNRIQLFKFDAIRQTITFLHMFGDGPGARHGQFDRPAGIVFNSKLEQIIVADKDNHRVQVFNISGTYLFKFGEQGSKCGQFCYPWDIDVCKTTHNIIVSDTRNRRIQMFNNLGRYLMHFGQPLDSPRGVVYLSPFQLLVSDFNKHRLVLISQNDDKTVSSSTTPSLLCSNTTTNGTNYLNKYITSNNNSNSMNMNNQFIITTTTTTINPSAPQKLSNHHHHVRLASQLNNHQHQLHDSKFIGFGEGSSWGEFLRPQGATANGSLVYCSDSRNNRVACWNKETQNFSYICRDVVELDRPAGLAAIDNFLVIVDFGNNRVHICQHQQQHHQSIQHQQLLEKL